MSVNGFIYGTAVFRDAKPGEIVVTEDGAEYGETFRGPAEGPPRFRHLIPSRWRHVPGAGWNGDDTGVWRIRVLRDEP